MTVTGCPRGVTIAARFLWYLGFGDAHFGRLAETDKAQQK